MSKKKGKDEKKAKSEGKIWKCHFFFVTLQRDLNILWFTFEHFVVDI